MTNEDMVLLIQQGNKDYYQKLWHNVKKLMSLILNKKLNKISLPNYINREDVEQELYFAMCNAVNAYDKAKGYKFNSYLEYHIMNAIRSILPNKPLQETSYNISVGEDDNTELMEFIEDENARDKIFQIELTDLQQRTREAVAQLPQSERDIITLYFFKNKTFAQIAEIYGITANAVQQTKNKALRNLRKDRRIQGIYNEFYRHYDGTEIYWSLALCKWDYSKERKAVLDEIKAKRDKGVYISYGTESAMLYVAKQKFLKNEVQNAKVLNL